MQAGGGVNDAYYFDQCISLENVNHDGEYLKFLFFEFCYSNATLRLFSWGKDRGLTNGRILEGRPALILFLQRLTLELFELGRL